MQKDAAPRCDHLARRDQVVRDGWEAAVRLGSGRRLSPAEAGASRLRATGPYEAAPHRRQELQAGGVASSSRRLAPVASVWSGQTSLQLEERTWFRNGWEANLDRD
jgi:hypothetical protein